jgi:hypothetical protein
MARTSCRYHRFAGKEAYASGRMAEEKLVQFSRKARSRKGRTESRFTREKPWIRLPPMTNGPQPHRHVSIDGVKAAGSMNQPVPVATTNS